uniref:Tf2-1-like SH3-like domain-containing protein n=1 Tax=Mastacembelus armatus TaxID=205130 RepID=A0A3Q3MQA0_9TELE
MATDIKRYVTSCTICQLTKPSQRKPAGFMVPISPQKPWEYAGVDFIGPLPHTPSGNAYIIVFVDYFSKWVEVCALKEASALVAASKFVSEIFARHSNPTYLISIRAYVGDKHTSWDKFISQICFALRTAPHESTGLSTSMMLCGRELETPVDLLIQRRHTTYEVGDLVRVKSHPRSDALFSFTAKLAPLYTGPFRVSQKLGPVNYRLIRLDTGTDAGVFHVFNLSIPGSLLLHPETSSLPQSDLCLV